VVRATLLKKLNPQGLNTHCKVKKKMYLQTSLKEIYSNSKQLQDAQQKLTGLIKEQNIAVVERY
jgi:hypothetical protein